MENWRHLSNNQSVGHSICDPFAHLLTSDLVNLRMNGRTTNGRVSPPLSLFLCAFRPPTHRSVAPYKAARGSLHSDQSRPFRSPSHWDRRRKRRSSRKAGRSKTEVKPLSEFFKCIIICCFIHALNKRCHPALDQRRGLVSGVHFVFRKLGGPRVYVKSECGIPRATSNL